MNIDVDFSKRKTQLLKSDDRSKKGSIDQPIEELVREMNSHDMLCTTSSCSGRVTLFAEEQDSIGSKGGQWVYITHTYPIIHEIRRSIDAFLEENSLGRLTFRFEPFIIACECGSLDIAGKLVQCGREAGFRESGVVFGKNKIQVTIRSTSRLEIPVCENGLLLIPDEYLTCIVRLATERFQQNVQKTHSFSTIFKSTFLASYAGPTRQPDSNSLDSALFTTRDQSMLHFRWSPLPLDDASMSGLLDRWGHSACVVNECIVVFGGYGGLSSHQRLNDVIVYNPSSSSLEVPVLKGEIPGPRMNHAAVSIGIHVYIIGGRTHPDNPLNTVYKINTDSWVCQKTGLSIPARFRHSACVDVLGKVYVFGGRGLDGPMNDVWIMNVVGEVTFSAIDTGGKKPSPRMSHGACIQETSLYIYGGFADYGFVHNDLFKLDLTSLVWEEIELPGVRLPKAFSHSLIALDKSILAIIGGYQSDVDRVVLLDPNASHARFLRTDTKRVIPWSPLRHTVVMIDNSLFTIGGGAFCFSFGSMFSSSSVIDAQPLIYIFKEGIARMEDIDDAAAIGETRHGIVVSKRFAKEIKDALKKLGWLSTEYKSTVLEAGHRIAFPLVTSCLTPIQQLFRHQFIGEGDSQAMEILQSHLSEPGTVLQEMDFASSLAIQSPGKRLKRLLASRLRTLPQPQQDSLLAEVPEKWERLGDLILLPSDCMLSSVWEQHFGECVWRDVAQSLGCNRLARQAPIAKAETRHSRAVMLYGDDGWVLHKENGVFFRLDVTKCMFSSGNVTERIRMAEIPCEGETIVDLYAGIGYYTLPILKKAKAEKVIACEWNRNAILSLELNLKGNGVADRCEIRRGDCRKVAPVDVADRVLLGLLPSSKGGWKTALAALKFFGGWLHLHQNVLDKEKTSSIRQILAELAALARELQREWSVSLIHCEHVKWYAPHIAHLVLDIHCTPNTAKPQELTPTDRLVVELDSVSRERFWSTIIPARRYRKGVVVDLDVGSAMNLWSAEYLETHAEASSKRVSVHVCTDAHGYMNFVHKNFQFHTMPFSELITRCSNPTSLRPCINPGERYYYRSIGQNPRKERSWFHKSFPLLAEDLQLPDIVDENRLFSTVLRISSAGVRLWTHFDTVDNLLIEIRGRKRVRIWPPSSDRYLYVTGSTSEVIDIDRPDLDRYPNFNRAKSEEFWLEAGDVLYIPALWFHNIQSETFCVSVNAFFCHLPDEFYDHKDLYGNRDPPVVQKAFERCSWICDSLAALPADYRAFYEDRFKRCFERDLDDRN